MRVITLYRGFSVILVTLLLAPVIPTTEITMGLVVVVTLPSLVGDVERIASNCGDIVVSIIPPGVDIHEYQLTTENVNLLKRADLIVSTGHTYFEHKIRELVESGELKAKLLDILELPGLKLSINPVTEQPNYHVPIKDPVNYLLFILNLTRLLAEINPTSANCYYTNYYNIVSHVYTTILVYRNKYRGLAVVDTPHAQYYVEWAGFNVVWILKYEEETPVTVESIERTRQLISSRLVDIVVVTEGFQGRELLIEEAVKHGVPFISVPHYSSEVSVLEALQVVVSQLEELRLSGKESTETCVAPEIAQISVLYLTSALAVGVLIGVLISELYERRGVWRLK